MIINNTICSPRYLLIKSIQKTAKSHLQQQQNNHDHYIASNYTYDKFDASTLSFSDQLEIAKKSLT